MAITRIIMRPMGSDRPYQFDLDLSLPQGQDEGGIWFMSRNSDLMIEAATGDVDPGRKPLFRTRVPWTSIAWIEEEE
jgi:hypothetical protein